AHGGAAARPQADRARAACGPGYAAERPPRTADRQEAQGLCKGRASPHGPEAEDPERGGLGMKRTAMDTSKGFYATGRRKNAVARVWMQAGSGVVLVNDRPMDAYFGRATSRMVLKQPLELTETDGKYDITVNVAGGGLAGQAEAIRHGITRALCDINK